jgi:hypothetical protein
VATRDAYPLCDKPFYGKQNFVRYGTCEIRVHYMSVQQGYAELATAAATGESTYSYNACANFSDSISNDGTSDKSPECLSSYHEGAMSGASSNEDASFLMVTVSTQLEAVRTLHLLESIVDIGQQSEQGGSPP